MKHYQLFKLRAVLLLFALLCSMPSVWATPAYISGDSGPMWEYNAGTKTLTISGEGEVTKPSDLPWVNYDVEHIVIESGITSIGSMLFDGLTGLKSVTMANTVTKIGSYAFERCETLVTVSFSDNIEEIEEYAFNECYGITTITLPSMLTTIGNAAFSSCYQLTNLAIPDNVTSIGANAFYNCGITTINIPASVNDIGLNPFSSCKNLVDITVASTNTKYDSRNDCKAIIETSSNKLISGCKSTTIPEGVETIDANAFLRITGLTSITIPDGVRSIGNNAFNYCSNLQSIALPNSVQNLGIGVFENCYNLSSVSLSTNLNNIENALFYDCSSLVTLTIPASVTRFDDSAFLFCRSMTDVYCPLDPNDANTTIVLDDVHSDTFKENKGTYFHVFNKSIWETKFPNANVTFMGDLGKQYISGDSGPKWEYVNNTKSLTISGEGDMHSFESTDDTPWKDADVETITIEEGVTSIGDYAFKNMDVQSVSISKTVKFIGKGAFFGCSKLASLSLPEGVETIKESAFSGCPAIATVVLPSSLSVIQSMAFNGCTGVNHAYCHASPSTLTWTDNNVGFKDSKATSFHIANLTTWETNFPEANVTFVDDQEDSWTEKKYVYGTSGPMWQINNTTKTMIISGTGAMYSYFDDNKNLAPWSNNDFERVIINEGVTKIGQYSFYNSENLTSVSVPSSVTSIGEYAFAYCEDLSSINLPNNVTQLDYNTFYHCYSLTSIKLPTNLQEIKSGAFGWCTGLTSLTIPNTVTHIRDMAFANSGLISLTIPTSITSIEDNTFFNCFDLTSVFIPSTVKSIGDEAFMGCNSLKSIFIPSSVESIGEYAFRGCDAMTDIFICETINPDNFTWYPHSSSFKESKATICHVGNKADWQTKFPTANLTFVGDMGNISLLETNIEGNNVSLKVSDINAASLTNELVIPSTYDSGTNSYTINTICENAFQGCSNLTYISIPDGVKTIRSGAFSGCTNVGEVKYYASPTDLTWEGNNSGFKESKATFLHVSDKSVWQTVYPDANVTYIQDIADDWTTKKYIKGNSGPMWQYSSSLKTIKISGTGDIPDFYHTTSEWNEYTENVETVIIENGVTAIGSSAFYNWINIETVCIPNSVTSIGESAFHFCHSIHNLTIPNSVISMGSSVFQSCYELVSVTLPNNLSAIPAYAFALCEDLPSLVVPSSVTSIGSSAFEGCVSLRSLRIMGNISSIGNSVFKDCSALTDVYISGTTDPSLMMWTTTKEDFMPLKATVCHITDKDAWQTSFPTANLTFVGDLPIINKLECVVNGSDIGIKVASGYTSSITGELSIPTNYNDGINNYTITGIETNAFKDCTELLSVTIPNGVTTIGANAFEGCTGLSSIVVPFSVTVINANVFKNCNNLESATVYPCLLTTYGGNVFDNNKSNRKIYVYGDCVNTYKTGWSGYAEDILPITLMLNSNPQRTEDRWCTYYNNQANVKVPTGTTIYKAQLDQVNNKVVLTEVKGSVVAKGNAVMLKSSDANIALSSATTFDLGTYSDNDLKGGDVTSGYIAYTLAGINGIMGFYRFTGNSLDPNKAHLEVANSNPNSAPQLIPFDNGTTEIMLNTVKTAEDKGEWYSLDGRQIQGKPTQKGIYVKKGKKYVVK